MNNYLILNKKYIQKTFYEKLISNNVDFAIMECKCKNFNILYAIEENDIFVYFGSNIQCINSISFTNIENKKNYTIIFNIQKVYDYINKFYEKSKFDNLYLFHSKLKLLNESYKDLYSKLLINTNKKNNLIFYKCKKSDIEINFTNYIFDIIYISDDTFNDVINNISKIKININKLMILNMNYLLFQLNLQHLFDLQVLENEIYLSNNNKKYKNFSITLFKNVHDIEKFRKKYLDFDIIKILS